MNNRETIRFITDDFTHFVCVSSNGMTTRPCLNDYIKTKIIKQ